MYPVALSGPRSGGGPGRLTGASAPHDCRACGPVPTLYSPCGVRVKRHDTLMPRRSVLPFRSPLGTLRSDLSLPRPHYFVPLFSTLLRSLLSFLPYSIIPTPNSQISTIPRTTNLKIPLTRQPVPPAISHPRPNLNLKALPQLRNKIYFRQRRQSQPRR